MLSASTALKLLGHAQLAAPISKTLRDRGLGGKLLIIAVQDSKLCFTEMLEGRTTHQQLAKCIFDLNERKLVRAVAVPSDEQDAWQALRELEAAAEAAADRAARDRVEPEAAPGDRVAPEAAPEGRVAPAAALEDRVEPEASDDATMEDTV